jgi:molybdopterin synthase sulfur carrier subunit
MKVAMKVQVRYFASLREALGPAETVEIAPGLSIAALRAHLRERSESHAAALAPGRAVRCALNQRLAHDDTVIGDGAEVAFFPPVTGG